MATADTPQPLTLFEAIIPLASLIVLVALSYYLFGDAGALGPNQVALVLATMIAVFVGRANISRLPETRRSTRSSHAAARRAC